MVASPDILEQVETRIISILAENKIAVSSSFGGDLSENALKEKMPSRKKVPYGFLAYAGDSQRPEVQSGGLRIFPGFNLAFVMNHAKNEKDARHLCYEALVRSAALLAHNKLDLDIQPLTIGPAETVLFETYDDAGKKKFQNYAAYGFEISTAIDIAPNNEGSLADLNEFITLPGSLLEATATLNPET